MERRSCLTRTRLDGRENLSPPDSRGERQQALAYRFSGGVGMDRERMELSGQFIG